MKHLRLILLFSPLFLIPLVLIPDFYAPHVTSRFLVLAVVTLISLAFMVVSQKQFFYPRMGKASYAFIAFFALILLGFFIHPLGGSLEFSLKCLLFFLICVVHFEEFKNDPDYFKYLDWTSLLCLALASIKALIVLLPNPDALFARQSDVPFFANTNFLAEYLSILVVIQGVQILKARHTPIRSLKAVALVLGLSVLFLLKARANILGVGLAALVVFLSKKVTKKKLIASLTALVGLAALVVFLSFDANKINTQNYRTIRIQNTLEMIQKNPLGVGAGAFEHNYIKYRRAHGVDPESNEKITVTNPHNAFLEMAAEQGIVPFLVFAGILFLLFRRILLSKKNSIVTLVSVGLFVYFLVDGFLCFPQVNPATFFGMAMTAAIVFAEGFDSYKLKNSARFLFFMSFIALLITIIGYRVFLSDYLDTKYYDDYESMIKACDLNNQNWRTCLQRARMEYLTGHFDLAEQTIGDVLKKYPDHYIATRYAGELYLQMNDLERACSYYRKYDEFYGRLSSVHELVAKSCH